MGQGGARRCKVNILRVINWVRSEVVAMWGKVGQGVVRLIY